MIMDRTALFSNAQAITADAASANIIDLSATGTVYGAGSALTRDIGPGRSIPLFVGVVETFTNLTSMVIKVQTDTTAAFSTPKDVFTSPSYTLAQLAVGAKENLLPDSIPWGTDEEFVRLYYDITGSAPDAGKITAGVVMDRQSNMS